jgi:2,3-dihydroxybenzoate decarboxylase
MKKIAVEEHANKQDIEHLDKRLKDMDEAGIDMQVLSYAPERFEGMDTAAIVARIKSINDQLAGVTEKYPERFAAFAYLPLQDPNAAAGELERVVKQLGLKGALIFLGPGEEYLDDGKYWGVFEVAEQLDVPIYLHPGGMSPDIIVPYKVYPILTGAMWGFAVKVSLQAMRLICSGVFDKYPRLKIILGHMGEGIPYFLWRIDKHWLGGREFFDVDVPGFDLKKKPSEYFKENFYVTTSGMLWHPVLQFGLSVLGADRILFAADYPPESALEAAQFIESAPISDNDKEKICHLNAEKLLRL